MPSPLHVPVACIAWIAPHPNADSLDIVGVLGWQCIVRRGEFKINDRIVYFPIDTVLTRKLSDHLGVTQYLDKQRIKATRLRGEPSFGLVIPAPEGFEVGDNVASYYEAIKWSPPTREDAQRSQGKVYDFPNALPSDPLFPQYTHIDNLRHFPDLIGSNELVVVTEKLHGTNSRIGIIDGQWMAGSHKVRRGEGDALYWSPKSQPGVEVMITALAKYHRQVVLYGEILGSDVQSLDYGYEGDEGYAAFDLMVDGRYLDYPMFYEVCMHYTVPMVPELAISCMDFDTIRKLANGKTLARMTDPDCAAQPTHLREGVVVKPLIERSDPRIGRVILKYVSDDFLLAKKTDFSEV